MPLVDPGTGNPYPSVGSVMNVARARINDMINDVNGDLLTNDAPYAQTYLSAAWRWYQDRCSTVGVETLIRETVLHELPPRANDDVANQAWVSWLGCSDGVSQYDLAALPQDLIQPLSVWRRESDVNAPFHLMKQAEDGLPTWLDTNIYDWREDGLYFFAPHHSQDLRIRYSAYRSDLDITQPDTLVPMMRCEDCLGARVAFEFANARGSAQAASMQAWAEDAFQNGAAQRTNRRKQRQTIRRQPYSRSGCGNAWPVVGS